MDAGFRQRTHTRHAVVWRLHDQQVSPPIPRARLAQGSSLGRLTDQDAMSVARRARCRGRQGCSVAGVAHRSLGPEDLDLPDPAAQGTCALFARAARVAVERAQATVDVVSGADPFTDGAGLFVSLVAPVAGVRPGAAGSGDDGNDLSADTAQAGRAGVAAAADRPVGGQGVDPACPSATAAGLSVLGSTSLAEAGAVGAGGGRGDQPGDRRSRRRSTSG